MRLAQLFSLMDQGIAQLRRIFIVFETFRANMNNSQAKAGALFAFRSCYEHAWHAIKENLQFAGALAESQKETIQEAAKRSWIKDSKRWMEFKRANAKRVDVYDPRSMDGVAKVFDAFAEEMQFLLDKLERDSRPQQRPTNSRTRPIDSRTSSSPPRQIYPI